MWGLFLRVSVLSAGLALLLVSVFAQAATGTDAANKPRVLILATSVVGGTSSIEATQAKADGFAVTVASAKQWDKMTTAQFKLYRALIIGDHEDNSNHTLLDVQPAVDVAFVWGHAINGNIILTGADPGYHSTHGSTGAKTYIAKAIAFAGAKKGRTGFYFAGGGYYGSDTTPQHVEVLDGLKYNGFYWIGDGAEGQDNIHIDPAVTPAPHGLSNTILSGWSETAHRAFTKWPSSFHVWAVGVDSSGNWTTSDNVKGWASFLVSTR
jgi:hypothetical protein